MEIIHIGAECYPVAKVGGLGDVVGALPKYQSRAGHNVKVVLPEYDTEYIRQHKFEKIYSNTLQLGETAHPFKVLKQKTTSFEYELYLISIPTLFKRKQIYGYEDDIERFLAFQIAFLDWLLTQDSLPDIINCHDHHTGLVPFMMQNAYKYEKLRNIATVITIHNSIYQGQFGFEKLYYLPEFDLSKVHLLEWDNRINSLATAVKCASSVTTVSPSYLDEINQYAYGLETLFQMERAKSSGILNGIDTSVWNPETDEMLETQYSIKNFKSGKQKNKDKLCQEYKLDPKKPLFSFIGRLLDEKGADLLPHTIATALSENPKGLNFLILGSGNTLIENQLMHLATAFQGNYNVVIGYNEALAHKIYASSDFLLMPSRVEPCGLNQMYALKYGTIPIVRRTGGLKDTVIDFGDDGNGICHNQASVNDICYSVQRAIALYTDKKKLKEIQQLGMKLDHSWESVCKQYLEMYNIIKTKK